MVQVFLVVVVVDNEDDVSEESEDMNMSMGGGLVIPTES